MCCHVKPQPLAEVCWVRNKSVSALSSDELIKDMCPLQTETPSVDNIESVIPQSYIFQESELARVM